MARTNLQIKVGTYTGDGTDDRNITGVGFRPQVLIIKGGTNVACVRLGRMRGDSSVSFSSALATAANQIQELQNDGFQVGSSALVNANGTTYYYVAMRGNSAQQYLRTGNYVGNASDSRNLTTAGVNFTPDIAMIFGDTTQQKVWRSTSMSGDSTGYWGGVANATDRIQNLQSNGFQLGTSSEVNGSSVEYFFAAIKSFPGIIAYGTYAGDGIDDKAITGVGFQADALFVKRDGASQGRLKTSSITDTNSLFLGAAAAATTGIKTITSDGFTVGTDNSVNNNASTYYWIAFKVGNFNVPISRSTA
jgi:hypothetical protein